jgi:3-hydroxyisobutyrate dehydrogenase-like beta-hydroxyacid dehydrogenase
MARRAGSIKTKSTPSLGLTSRQLAHVPDALKAKNRYEPATMQVSTWQMDMAIIAAFAQGLGVETPLFSTTAPAYDEAMAKGFGD